jgi:hypothetical protein
VRDTQTYTYTHTHTHTHRPAYELINLISFLESRLKILEEAKDHFWGCGATDDDDDKAHCPTLDPMLNA